MASYRYHRLQYRFLSFFILVALPPLIFLGLVAAWSVEKTRAANVTELETQLTKNITERIQKFILDRVEGLELHVPDRTTTDIARVTSENQLLLLEQFLQLPDFRGIETITMVDVRGNEIQKVRRDRAIITLTSIANTDLFRRARDEGRYFSAVQFRNGKFTMSLAARILNGDGFFIGVLTADMDLSFIHDEILADVVLGDEGYVYVVDQEKRIVGHSRKYTSNVEVASISEKVRSVTTTLPALSLTLIAEWPETDAFAVVRTIQQQIIIFVIATFLLILLASLFLARQVTRPIAELRAGATTIGSGKFDHRIDLHRRDELQELAESFNTMAQNVQELDALRTTKVRNTVLAEALAKEQELSREKDTFISVMSHQLRTPLTSLQWSMEFLSGELQKPELKKYIDFIKDGAESSKQVTMIVDDLLTVAELGIGYHVTNPELVDVAKLLRKIGVEVAARSAEKKLDFAVHIPETSLLVAGSSLNLQKVFLNLLDNAITYTQKGSVTVAIQEEGEQCVITVQDTGIGIPKGEQRDVFKEFFRAKNAIVGKNVGTGLGLFIVKTVVIGHGGTITFVSEEGRGTTFTVTLPKKQTTV